jgi:hypothetical protein
MYWLVVYETKGFVPSLLGSVAVLGVIYILQVYDTVNRCVLDGTMDLAYIRFCRSNDGISLLVDLRHLPPIAEDDCSSGWLGLCWSLSNRDGSLGRWQWLVYDRLSLQYEYRISQISNFKLRKMLAEEKGTPDEKSSSASPSYVIFACPNYTCTCTCI